MRHFGVWCPLVHHLAMRCLGTAMVSTAARKHSTLTRATNNGGGGVAACRSVATVGAQSVREEIPSLSVGNAMPLIDVCEVLTNAVEDASQRRGSSTQRSSRDDVRHHFRALLARITDSRGNLDTELGLQAANVPTLTMVLASLSNASRLLEEERQLHYRSTTSFLDENLTDDAAASFSSPYMQEDTLDVVSAIAAFCIRTSVLKHNGVLQDVYEALHHAIQLEVGDPDTLLLACRHLASAPMACQMSSHELVQTVHLITLCHKRRKVPLPILDHLLAPLHGAKDLTPRELMVVLSALVRAGRNGLSWETVRVLSYRLGQLVLQDAENEHTGCTPSPFSNRDIVFGFRVVAMADGCSDIFAAAIIASCCKRSSTLTASELGDVCKFMKRIHTSRSMGHLTRSTCGKETRRLMPQLLARARELLGTFSLRDARHVLECISAFKLRHSIVFAQLTPFVSKG